MNRVAGLSRLENKFRPAGGTPSESYPVKELAGCEVFTQTGESLGVLVDVLPAGGNDVFVVRRGDQEVLIPALKTVVQKIDLSARRMEVVLPAGLREIYEGL